VRLYLHKYDPIDLPHIDEAERPKGLLLWKCHHSFCDGVSAGSLILALSKEFDRSYFLPTKDLSFISSILARVVSIFQLPRILINTLQ
jgi:NRPS condensation-like uncharacterized protein